MADYFDYQGVNSGHIEAGPSGFVRPINLAGDRKSGNTYHSRGSGLTYATDGSAPAPDSTQRSPAEPINGIPSPVIGSKGLRLQGERQYDDEEEEEEEEDDEDPEYMMVDADLSMVSQFEAQNQPLASPFQEPPLKVMNNKPVPVKVQGGRKGFVGGFVSGLRRLPRLLRNQRGKSVQRQSSHDTVSELPGFGEDSPGYDPFRAHPPTIPQSSSILHHPPPISHRVPSASASHPVTSMHYSHYTHDERSEKSGSPVSRDPNDFDSEELDHGQHHSDSDEEGDQHSTHKPSTIAHSTHHSTTHQSTRYSHHSTHHSNHPSNQDSGRKSNHQSRHPSPHRSATPSRPPTALDGDTTLIHQTQNGEPEAVVAHLLPTSDYKSMPPAQSSPSAPSLATNVNKIQKFITDVYNLPWVAAQVTVDFVPERDGRKYRGMDPDVKKVPDPPQSWYPPLHKDIDLLEGESPPRSAPVMAHRRQDGHRRALTESTATQTATQSVTHSTTYSPRRYSVNSEPIPRHPRNTRDFRHSHRQRRRHRDHSRPHTPPIYPVLASPQPLYLYPGPASPPIMSMPQPQPAVGSSASSPRSRRGIASPAVPVYVIPMPPPVYQPMSGFPYPAPQPTQSPLAQSQPAPSQPAQSRPASDPPKSN